MAANGELGNGATANSALPQRVGSLTGVTKISTGENHAMALTADGQFNTWGLGQHGRLGTGDTANRLSPTAVMTGAVDIDGGEMHSLAALGSGVVMGWGNNSNGNVTTANAPTVVLLPVDTGLRVSPRLAASVVTADSGGGVCHLYTTAVGAPVTFDASASTDSQGLALSHSWDLNGDGLFGDATGARASATFANAGSYSVAVKATDSQDASAVAYATLLVTDHAPFANPGGHYQGVAGNTLVLDGSGSSDPDPGDRLTYAWDLQGNGQSPTARRPR
jgi:hypothetical protein